MPRKNKNKKNKKLSKGQKRRDRINSVYDAIYDNDVKKIRKYVKSGFDMNTYDDEGDAMLPFASIHGKYEIVCELIKLGIDLEQRNHDNGNTSLIMASYYGEGKIVQKLIECKVNLEAYNDCNWNALEIAILGKHRDIVYMLINAGASTKIPCIVNPPGGLLIINYDYYNLLSHENAMKYEEKEEKEEKKEIVEN